MRSTPPEPGRGRRCRSAPLSSRRSPPRRNPKEPPMTARIDLTGQRFGRLVIGELAEIRGRWAWWHSTCDCGTKKIVKSATLRNGKVRSCGCLAREMTATRNRLLAKQSGEAIRHTPEYVTWQSMKNRCSNANGKKYKYYGGAGVVVCSRWLESYFNFLADMGRRPSSEYSLDRFPDPNGNYEPGNCRWATILEQRHNRRDSHPRRDR